jgi:hypothetical protein
MSSLAGRDIVVFDCEIKNEIGKNGVTWTTYDKMGVSVAVAFSFKTMDYRVYMDDNLTELAHQLNAAELVVGFNILKFDLPLLMATKEMAAFLRPDLPIYDLYAHSLEAAGVGNGGTRPKGMSLDNHLMGTFGQHELKTESGANAPIFWQQKKIGRLISYCLADVKRESKLFRHVWDHATFKTDTLGIKKCVRRPQEVLGVQ